MTIREYLQNLKTHHYPTLSNAYSFFSKIIAVQRTVPPPVAFLQSYAWKRLLPIRVYLPEFLSNFIDRLPAAAKLLGG